MACSAFHPCVRIRFSIKIKVFSSPDLVLSFSIAMHIVSTPSFVSFNSRVLAARFGKYISSAFLHLKSWIKVLLFTIKGLACVFCTQTFPSIFRAAGTPLLICALCGQPQKGQVKNKKGCPCTSQVTSLFYVFCFFSVQCMSCEETEICGRIQAQINGLKHMEAAGGRWQLSLPERADVLFHSSWYHPGA